jgi:Transcriptional regulator PadR-like family
MTRGLVRPIHRDRCVHRTAPSELHLRVHDLGDVSPNPRLGSQLVFQSHSTPRPPQTLAASSQVESLIATPRIEFPAPPQVSAPRRFRTRPATIHPDFGNLDSISLVNLRLSMSALAEVITRESTLCPVLDNRQSSVYHRCQIEGRVSSMAKQEQQRVRLLQGTLDMLILRTLLYGPARGHQIGKRMQRTPNEFLPMQNGSLHPALNRLERRGWVESQSPGRRIAVAADGRSWSARAGARRRGELT